MVNVCIKAMKTITDIREEVIMSKEVRSFEILKFSKVSKEFPDTLRPKHNSYYSEKILIMLLKYFLIAITIT